MPYILRVAIWASLALGGVVWPAQAAPAGETLVYQGTNKWVAPADNAPLGRLVARARAGVDAFAVRCPKTNRPMCKERLDVLHNLLNQAQPQGAVMLREVPGPAPASNTLWVAPQR